MDFAIIKSKKVNKTMRVNYGKATGKISRDRTFADYDV